MAALEHGGIDGAGMDGITSDLVFGVLDRSDFRKHSHSTFRGIIGRGANRNNTRDGGDVNNRPTTSAPHGRDGVLGAQKDSGAIDGHHLVPDFPGGLFNREATDYAGVV